MIIYENQCVGCPPETGCLGPACDRRNVPVLVCDRCGDTYMVEKWTTGEDLCRDCMNEDSKYA